jgi:hypothetical protein
MTYPHSWDEDHDAGIRMTWYLIGALSIALCVAMFVYLILMSRSTDVGLSGIFVVFEFSSHFFSNFKDV